jgi:uncharacterized protein
MPRVIHFEFPADDPQRAADFYGKVFGWKFSKWDGPQEYWMVSTGADAQPGINGGMMRRQQPGAGTCNTLDVASLDDAVAAVTRNGGRNVVPRMAIPGVGYVAYCSDTEGNVFGLIEADAKAV